MAERIRILQVVGGLDRAGTETFLMNVLRNLDQTRFQMDFLVHEEREFDYESEAKALGAQILRCLYPSKRWTYLWTLSEVFRRYGPYRVVHSHIHHFSGLILLSAAMNGVPVRIAHSHTTDAGVGRDIPRRLYEYLAEGMIQNFATHKFGASRETCESLYGQKCWGDERVRVLKNGIDPRYFTHPQSKALSDGTRSITIGHIGRFEAPKNHLFILKIFAYILKKQLNAQLVLVGDGRLRHSIEKAISEAGIQDRVHLLGKRTDVHAILPSFDVMLFPSLYEGLPLAVIEAQTAGIPCVLSTGVSREVDMGLGLTTFLSLSEPEESWMDAILNATRSPAPGHQECAEALSRAGFNIREVCNELQEFYSGSAL